MLQRFRQEKAKFQRGSYTGGFKDGVTWAQKASYSSMQYYRHIGQPKFDTLPEDESRDVIGEIMGLKEAIDLQMFADGWFKGVRTFGEWVDDQLTPPDESDNVVKGGQS